MAKRETEFTKKVVEHIKKEYGALVIKYHVSVYDRTGFPDLMICYNGKFIGIEIKASNVNGTVKKPTPLQLENIRRINEMYGGIAF